MRQLLWFGFAALAMSACSANDGQSRQDLSSGLQGGNVPTGPDGVGAADCNSNTNCAGCTDCFSNCLCLTGNAETCASACGNTGGGEVPGGTAGAGSGGAPGSGGTPGTGGVPGSGGTPGTGGTPGGTGGSSGSAGSAGGGTAGSGGGGDNCTYPTGPYGTQVGDIVGQNLSWEGFDDDGAQRTITIDEYFDCDGSKGINAVLFIHSATWCGACQQEAAELNSHMSGSWGQAGIKSLTLMIENSSGSPATIQTAQQWKDSFSASGWGVVADPQFTFANFGSNGLPTQILIDPRTMEIIDKQQGYSPSYPAMMQLANSNATN